MGSLVNWTQLKNGSNISELENTAIETFHIKIERGKR